MSTPELYNTELFKEKTDQTKSFLIRSNALMVVLTFRSNALTVVLTFMSIISLLYVFFFLIRLIGLCRSSYMDVVFTVCLVCSVH